MDRELLLCPGKALPSSDMTFEDVTEKSLVGSLLNGRLVISFQNKHMWHSS